MSIPYKNLILCCFLIALSACRPGGGDVYTVTVSAGNHLRTKAVADTREERTVHRLDLFAFNADGVLENSSHSTDVNDSGTLSATVTLTGGNKDFYLVANAPAALAASVTSVGELFEALSLFSQNARDGFVMTASLTDVSVTGDRTLEADLVRIASRVELQSVTKAFNSPALQSLPFRIEAVFLMNIPMQAHYFAASETLGDASASSGWGYWCRNNGSVLPDNPPTDAVRATTRWEPDSPVSVTGSTEATAGHYLYAYPNIAPEASGAGGTDYVTKLVLQTKLGDDTLYYTLGIPQCGRNKAFEINQLTIKRRGTRVPGQYVSTDDVSLRVTVRDWDSGVIQSSYADGGAGSFSI